MENIQTEQNQTMQAPSPSAKATGDLRAAPMTQEEIMQEILENSRKTRNYMKWQLYITLVLVVLPLLAMIIVIPMVLRSLSSIGSIYGAGGLLQ